MSVFSRYIMSEFLKRFFPIFFILIILFLGIDVLSRIWDLDASLSQLSFYYLFKVPAVAVQMLPVSILLATLMLFSYLSRHNELVALYCSGRSLLRVASPVILLVILVNIFSFLLSDYVLPLTNYKAEKIWVVDIHGNKEQFYGALNREQAWFRDRGAIYKIHSYNSAENSILGMNIYYFDQDFDMTQHIYARTGHYKGDDIWTLRDVKNTDFTSGQARVYRLNEKSVYIQEKPEDLRRVETNSDYLGSSKLREYVRSLERSGLSASKYRVEYNRRYSMSFAGLVMCFIGIPFAVRQQRRGAVGLNMGIGFVIVFVYWIIFSVMLSFGISGRLGAFTAAWGANIMFLVASLIMIKLSRK